MMIYNGFILTQSKNGREMTEKTLPERHGPLNGATSHARQGADEEGFKH
jgi:hypothetical protein